MRIFIISCLLILSLQSVAFADVENYVTSLVNQVSATLAQTNVSENSKISSSRQLLEQNLDFNTMSRNVLGQYYKQLTIEQQQSFIVAYKKYLINTYSSLVKKYRGQVAKIKNVKPITNSSYIVQTLVEQEGQSPIKADYYVISSGNSYKVADIITEGISLIATHKAEFCEIISNEGFDSLLSTIKSKY